MNNVEFLKKLSKKTMYVAEYTLTPNISKRSFRAKCFEFTSNALTAEELKKILSIVTEELLLIFPREGFMGNIEGFAVYGLDGKLIILLGEKNLPEVNKEYTIERIFNEYCKNNQNITILEEIQKEGKLQNHHIKNNFFEYCY